MKRKRLIGSVKSELIKKSREAALAAVQIFNNPLIQFKSEMFIVLKVIAWTYLLHAYYRDKKVEYRHHSFSDRGRKKFDTTAKGKHKYWELERCINDRLCPIDRDTANNLRFLIGIRHEIEHQMTTRIDNLLSARFQACCLNYNNYIKQFFGDSCGIDKHLSFSLQFSTMAEEQVTMLSDQKGLPGHILKYIEGFDGELSDEEFSSQKFAYRVIFVPKLVNRVGQADEVIEFIKHDSEAAKDFNARYAYYKETEKTKYLPKQIVKIMKEQGYINFSVHYHTQLWKSLNAKDRKYGFGADVAGSWYWYESWIKRVKMHCEENVNKYSF